MKLVWGDNELDVPMLCIPRNLSTAYYATGSIAEALYRGELERTNRGVEEWIHKAPSIMAQRKRRKDLNLTKDFLEGAQIENAHLVLQGKYIAYLNCDPAAQAAKVVCKSNIITKRAFFVPDDLPDVLAVQWLPDWVVA